MGLAALGGTSPFKRAFSLASRTFFYFSAALDCFHCFLEWPRSPPTRVASACMAQEAAREGVVPLYALLHTSYVSQVRLNHEARLNEAAAGSSKKCVYAGHM